MAKLMPADFRPCDIGYTRIGIWVEDFDATTEKACPTWQSAADSATGRAGRRRACVRSTPDGVYVEIMEDDPLPESNRRGRVDCPSAIRSVTVSVPQLVKMPLPFSRRASACKASTVALHRQSTRRCGAWRVPPRRAGCSTAARC